jgi:ABC-type Zn uptake system ZnuABC Zn-binding protein ZnuA
VVYWSLYIRDVLIELDPDGAEAYTANAAAYIAALDAIAHDFITPSVATIPEDRRVLVTNHATLGYFASRYGFEVVGTVIPGASTSAEPSAEQVAGLVDIVRAEGVQAIFADSTVNTRLAEQVASETATAFIRLYTDSFGESEASNYMDYIRYNVSAIVSALGGTPVNE